MVEAAVSAFGSLDCCLNNAGIGHKLSKLDEVEDELFDLVNDINYRGVFNCLKYQTQQMMLQWKDESRQPRQESTIVNVASIAGLLEVPPSFPFTLLPRRPSSPSPVLLRRHTALLSE
jgi:A-factor type gamma-butyrolactone 1'-reductase (1S-forming)